MVKRLCLCLRASERDYQLNEWFTVGNAINHFKWQMTVNWLICLLQIVRPECVCVGVCLSALSPSTLWNENSRWLCAVICYGRLDFRKQWRHWNVEEIKLPQLLDLHNQLLMSCIMDHDRWMIDVNCKWCCSQKKNDHFDLATIGDELLKCNKVHVVHPQPHHINCILSGHLIN